MRVKARHQRRQIPQRRRRARPKRNGAAAAVKRLQLFGHVACLFQHTACVFHGNFSVFIQGDLVLFAVKQGDLQRGVVVIPKSVHKDRMEQNLDIWDFILSEEDMKKIAALDLRHSEIVDHSDPNFVKMLHGMKIHG